jgi:anti-sigma factor RsiW
MSVREFKIEESCPAADISAYLDGELLPQTELELELHLASCPDCTRELNYQKTMLLALDSTLDEPRFELPKNFSKTVVANAESHVSGLRRPGERLNAALICFALLLLSALALGSNAGRVLGAVTSVFEAILAVASTAANFVYNIALGTAVIFRTLFSTYVAASPSSAILYAAVFLAILFIFSRLLFRQST